MAVSLDEHVLLMLFVVGGKVFIESATEADRPATGFYFVVADRTLARAVEGI